MCEMGLFDKVDCGLLQLLRTEQAVGDPEASSKSACCSTSIDLVEEVHELFKIYFVVRFCTRDLDHCYNTRHKLVFCRAWLATYSKFLHRRLIRLVIGIRSLGPSH